jgi:hypothetical protein
MGLEFLKSYGAQRLGQYQEQPLLAMPDEDTEEDEDRPRSELGYEREPGAWRPLPVTSAKLDSGEMPRRYVDGCHAGHSVAWLQDVEGHPIPVMLAEIGGVCLRASGRVLSREFAVVERVVTMIIDPFPWHEVESFAAALRDAEPRLQLRLLPAAPPKAEGTTERRASYDFEAMRKQTQNRSNYEMEVLEELSLCQAPEIPSLVDGRLEPRLKRKDLQMCPVVGVIKQQREGYLHPAGWQTFFDLKPGERTPAFGLPSNAVPVVSWYLKLSGSHGMLPNWGVVRVELPRVYFEASGGDFNYIDRLSHALFQIRCRRSSYQRGPVSLEPIVRAEESLKSLFTPGTSLTQQFYRLTDL